MKLSHLCTLLEMRGTYLLLIPSSAGGGQEALKVNDSFAFLWKSFQGKADFSIDDISAALRAEYGLDPAEAEEEAGKVIKLWKEMGLLEK